MSKNYTSIDELVQKLKGPSGYGGSYGRETEPVIKKREAVGHSVESREIKELVEHEPEAEVKPFIKPRQETIELPPDLKKMGVTPAGETKFPSYKTISLPLPDDKVFIGLNRPINSSLRWLSELCLYLLKRSHLTLKNIHGKVLRIMIRK